MIAGEAALKIVMSGVTKFGLRQTPASKNQGHFCDRGDTCERKSAQPLGKDAAVIGEGTEEHPRFVMIKTRVGATGVVDMFSGEHSLGSANACVRSSGLDF